MLDVVFSIQAESGDVRRINIVSVGLRLVETLVWQNPSHFLDFETWFSGIQGLRSPNSIPLSGALAVVKDLLPLEVVLMMRAQALDSKRIPKRWMMNWRMFRSELIFKQWVLAWSPFKASIVKFTASKRSRWSQHHPNMHSTEVMCTDRLLYRSCMFAWNDMVPMTEDFHG